MASFDYREPETVEEAVELLQQHGDEAYIIAGGTALVTMIRQRLVHPGVLIGLWRIPGLDGVEQLPDGSVRIGAMTKHAAVERSSLVRQYDAAMGEAFGSVGTVRIRNQGTLGGHLAHADPAQDPPPVLLALDARVTLHGPGGSEEWPVSQLFRDYFETSLGPSQVVTGVVLPPRPRGPVATYLKFKTRTHDDYATVAVAVSARIDDMGWHDVRIAVGAAGPVPMRIAEAEMLLDGSPGDGEAIAEAAERVGDLVDPISDSRGSAAYKRAMARVWTRRALMSVRDQSAAETRSPSW
jgi:carbon-monoxide dehydrogenase medium subunit